MPPLLRFVSRPDALPDPSRGSRLVLIDLAFASGDDFARVTQRFLERVRGELALWIDHHDHPRWSDFAHDPRFVLISKLQARACPELVTPRIVARAGDVDELWAHADFDGCVAAAKFLRGGELPYAEADEDARFADAPGKGFRCSARGKRYLAASDQLQVHSPQAHGAFLHSLCEALRTGEEPRAFSQQVDALAEALAAHRRALAPVLARASRPHPEVLMLRVERASGPDKKFLLRQLEERARVALLYGDDWTTIATFDDERLDLSALPGLRGQRGYAFGRVLPQHFLDALIGMLSL